MSFVRPMRSATRWRLYNIFFLLRRWLGSHSFVLSSERTSLVGGQICSKIRGGIRLNLEIGLELSERIKEMHKINKQETYQIQKQLLSHCKEIVCFVKCDHARHINMNKRKNQIVRLKVDRSHQCVVMDLDLGMSEFIISCTHILK